MDDKVHEGLLWAAEKPLSSTKCNGKKQPNEKPPRHGEVLLVINQFFSLLDHFDFNPNSIFTLTQTSVYQWITMKQS